MATTKKYLDQDGLTKYTTLVKKAIGDSFSNAVTDISGDTTSPSYADDVNVTAVERSASFTKGGSNDTFPYKDTTYGAVSTTKDGLMTHEDKVKLNGIATGATKVTVDSALSTTSTNPVQNKVVNTAVEAAKKTVRQTVQSGTTALPILTAVSGSPTTGNNAEAGYDTALKFNPSTDTLYVGSGNQQVIIGGGGIALEASESERGTLTATTFSGSATGTETKLASETSGSEGANLIGYSSDTTVKDALDDIFDAIGDGSGGNSLTDRVEALETGKQDKLTAGTNISFSGTGNKTINAVDEKVAQTSDVETNANLPLLFGNAATPTSPGGTKYYGQGMVFNPSTGELKIKSSNDTIENNIVISKSGITFSNGTTDNDVTITRTNYGGTAARATADGNGLNIATNYALKSEILLPTPIIVTDFDPTATPIDAHKGKFIFYKDAGASTDTRNVFTEYIAVQDTSVTPNVWKYEKIGSTEVNLDVASITNSEIDTIWSTTAAAS